MTFGLLSVLRSIFGLLHPRQRRRVWALAGLGAINALLEAVGALLIFAMISSFVADGSEIESGVNDLVRRAVGAGPGDDATVAIAVLTLVFYVVKNVNTLIEQYAQQRTAHLAAADASTRVVSTYLRVPLSYHHLQATGTLLRNATSSTEVVFRSSLVAALSITSEILSGTALLVVIVVAEPTVTPWALAALAVMVAVTYRVLRPRMTRWGFETQDIADRSMQSLQECFGALRDARIAGREAYFVERYRVDRVAMAKAYWRVGTASAAPRLVLETAFVVVMVIVVLLLTVDKDDASGVGVLGLFAYAGFRLMPSSNRLISAMNNLRFGEGAVQVVLDALAVPQEQPDEPDTEPLTFDRGIELRGVSYAFPNADRLALRDVELTIARGETIGIVGPSGGGKSTLADLVVGLLQPTEGVVLVDGIDISRRLRAWRDRIGYVSQSVFLLDDSLRANVAFGADADGIDDGMVDHALAQAQLGDLVRELPEGLATRLGERGVRLSGGQRQRVAVARALYRQPDLLVFDEATAALDMRTEAELTRAIERIVGERTALIVAHRMSTIRRCDRLVFVKDGRISALGSYDDLLASSEGFRQLAQMGEANDRSA